MLSVPVWEILPSRAHKCVLCRSFKLLAVKFCVCSLSCTLCGDAMEGWPSLFPTWLLCATCWRLSLPHEFLWNFCWQTVDCVYATLCEVSVLFTNLSTLAPVPYCHGYVSGGVDHGVDSVVCLLDGVDCVFCLEGPPPSGPSAERAGFCHRWCFWHVLLQVCDAEAESTLWDQCWSSYLEAPSCLPSLPVSMRSFS